MLTRRQFRLNVSSACRHANSYKLLINYSNDVTETESANSFGAPSPTTRLSWRKHGINISPANISLGSPTTFPTALNIIQINPAITCWLFGTSVSLYTRSFNNSACRAIITAYQGIVPTVACSLHLALPYWAVPERYYCTIMGIKFHISYLYYIIQCYLPRI